MIQVNSLQQRIDLSHKTALDEREHALKARDEYLRSLEDRLHRQESENEQERGRLQGLVAKLELQLREQGRQIEQDKWKLTQEENRLKTMQVCLYFLLFPEIMALIQVSV